MTTQPPSDLDIWNLVRADDSVAFAVLFDRHSKKIYNHCFRRTGDWSQAEELTSTVFLHVWRKRSEFSPTSESLLPWLLGIANNSVKNAKRSHWRWSRLKSRTYQIETVDDGANEIAGRIDDERRMKQVLQQVNGLSSKHIEVIALCIWDELSDVEVAEALNIPVGTVRSRLSRARQKIREMESLSDSGNKLSIKPRHQEI